MHDIAACCRVVEDIAVYLGGVKNDDVPRKCWVLDAGRERQRFVTGPVAVGAVQK